MEIERNYDKCKGCEWHNKPYWSIINPCDNCPKESSLQTFTRWIDPTIERLQRENLQLKAEVDEANDSANWWHNRYNALQKRISKISQYMFTLKDEYSTDDYDIKCDVFNKIDELLKGDKSE